MYIHPTRRLVYLAHPRTASVATASALCTVGFEKPYRISHHARIHDERSPITPKSRKHWIAFTTVRNPYDAAVSWVFKQWSVRDELEPPVWSLDVFERALDWSNWTIDTGGRFWWLHGDVADVTLRFESLAFDLTELLQSLGADVPVLEPKNVSTARRGRHYREFYTEVTQRYIAERFGAEIERYGYEF